MLSANKTPLTPKGLPALAKAGYAVREECSLLAEQRFSVMNHRITTHDQTVDDFFSEVRRIAEETPCVRSVILYGSFARGDASHHSDIDLAFSLCDVNKWPELASKIQSSAKTLRQLNLVCIERIGKELRDSINTEGRFLYERQKG